MSVCFLVCEDALGMQFNGVTGVTTTVGKILTHPCNFMYQKFIHIP